VRSEPLRLGLFLRNGSRKGWRSSLRAGESCPNFDHRINSGPIIPVAPTHTPRMPAKCQREETLWPDVRSRLE
jgi:hypothetical protein